jgi:hypothetical protein
VALALAPAPFPLALFIRNFVENVDLWPNSDDTIVMGMIHCTMGLIII